MSQSPEQPRTSPPASVSKVTPSPFYRGQVDAQKDYPPREAGKRYLEGYATEYNSRAKQARNGNSA